MQFAAIFRVLGIMMMIFSLTNLPPMLVSEWYHDGLVTVFFITMAMTFFTGFLCWFPTRYSSKDIKNRDGFLIVVLFWSVLSFFAAIPFMLAHSLHVSFTDAIFESISGLTTTGTNVFTGLDSLPQAMRYYRQQIEFLGGMGIIVLAVAIMPMLGVGGMQLYRAETPGPIKDAKLTPRITETAKRLWYIYIGLTALCALGYWTAGMNLFDAVCESFATISTGGFSIHDASFGFYHNTSIYLVGTFFMLLGATNFALHFTFLRHYRLRNYWKDVEFRTFCWILLTATAVITTVLLAHHTYPNLWDSFVQSLFAVVSLGTTTGFVAGNFSTWPTFVPYLIMVVGIIGGCAGSTSGGFKVVRVLLLQKQSKREFQRLLHPKATLTIKFGDHVLPEYVIEAIWAFVSLFIVMFVVMVLLLLATGLDFTTAYGAVAACMSNTGAGIGKVALDFEVVNTFGKWVLIVAMLAGRLEIFTLLVLFTPTFWRR